jgi:predicted Zn-dependent peptidase
MRYLFIISFCFLFVATQAQKFTPKIIAKNGYAYTVVANDPLKARIYKLKNGLTVYLSVYKDSPRIQTFIAVRAGSKNDPANTTGLAHYLEHILFKGTSKLGTLDWTKEKPQIEKIEGLYEKYRQTADTTQRRKIYFQIDSISILASKYAIANEYDKILNNLGASGTNAYTWVEQTVYVNDIPANEIKKWATVEAERFAELTPRLFHTELEAVYEEKNKNLDNDMSKVFEKTFNGLFPNHPYGSQTTIGTVEHLKNPSIKEIKKYFYTYYVPNNMAICLSGDFDFDSTIKIIDQKFGKMKPKPLPNFIPFQEKPITEPVVKKVVGPSPECLVLCYRFPGASSSDAMTMEMFSRVLSNGQAGLMDLNLVQQQKVLNVSAFPYRMKDYSLNIIMAYPRKGQTLDQVKKLVLAQIDSIKQGKFDETLLKAIINNEKIGLMKELESNNARADKMLDAFIKGINWETYLTQLESLSKLNKKQIVAFANKYYGNNYVAVYKKIGKDSTIQKVPKPKISPVSMNREQQSDFYKTISKEKSVPINPVFIDFNKAFTRFSLDNKAEVLYLPNTENELFELSYSFDIGKEHNPKYALALAYLDYLGTEKLSNSDIKTEFYKLGCNYTISVGADKLRISLSGLNENLVPALQLLEDLLANPKADTEALKDLVDGILKQRNDAKLDKNTILRQALVSYAKYGAKSPFTNNISEDSLKSIQPQTLLNLIKNLSNYNHSIYFYGTNSQNDLKKILNKIHAKGTSLLPLPEKQIFIEQEINDNEVLWVNYDMVQAELLFLSKSVPYSTDLIPVVSLYNEYFGAGGMSSIVFQEIRESKALAYGCNSKFQIAKNQFSSNYDISYIGTQADKLPEALSAMKQLIENIPNSPSVFAIAKESMLNLLRTERITKTALFSAYENAKKYGLDYDLRQSIYEKVPQLTIENVIEFHNKNVKKNKTRLLIVGSKDKLDFKTLSEYGKIRELTLTEIFGY